MKDPDLRIYVVWVPIGITDLQLTVPRAMKRVTDPRVQHFWDVGGTLSKDYGRVLGLGQKQPAWDVFFLFDRQAEWTDQPPAPTYWMHQLDLAPERRLNGDTFTAEVNKLLQPRE